MDKSFSVPFFKTGLLALLLCLTVQSVIWLPHLASARIGVDYGFWLPNLLAGDFWRLTNGAWAMPWFNPAQCGGVPFHADPQGAYLSLTQALTAFISPVAALQVSFLVYAAAGFLGTLHLARARFALSPPASLFAAALFALNGMYAARMMVGHLSFAPFMLVPAMAACVVGAADRDFRGDVLRAAGFAALLAVMLEGGMAVLVLPAYLTLLLVAVLHAARGGGGLGRGLALLALGSLGGLALCAGKLAAVLGLMAAIPRDLYPLPGFRNAAEAAWVAARSLFFWPGPDMATALVNSAVTLEPHEFDYGVGPAPLVLMLMTAARLVWRRAVPPAKLRTRLLWETLAILLLVPIALNTYAAPWTALLKMVPVLRSSSNMLRWFAAYMLPAVLGGAMALDRLAGLRPSRAWALCTACLAGTLACIVVRDHGADGAGGLAVYDPAVVQDSWRRVTASGAVPPVRGLTVLRDRAGRPDMSVARGDALASGLSPLFCYDPLFGYRLERLRLGTLHEGGILEQRTASGGQVLNLRNPACMVFPRDNSCRPGDPFAASEVQAAGAFAAWRPFAWRKPAWAHVADWVGLASLAAWPLAVAGALLGRRRA